MKDNMKFCHHMVNDEAVYKEVVVIGNGPSGMVTSFMLAGNVPHLKEVPDDLPIDEMLRARLSNIPIGQSLYEIDLMELAEGLDGRSQNPIPLLMDALLRPCADLGVHANSLIEWRYDVEKRIDHIVLGRGPPGGSWHTFPADIRTLSPGAWLCLPPHTATSTKRLSARSVANYCRRYVHACNLQRFFRNDVVVTSVTPIQRTSAPCSAICPLNGNFLITGWDKMEGHPFRYICNRVVVACGANDRPNSLPSHIDTAALHSLSDVERALEFLQHRSENHHPEVVVVGSGLSAADAVIVARRSGARVRHLHRRAAPSLAALSPAIYPTYHMIYKMMTDGPPADCVDYVSYPNHIILDVTTDGDTRVNATDLQDYALKPKRVQILDINTNEVTELYVNLIAVFIGSKPDLFFLQTFFNLNCPNVKNCCTCNEQIKPVKCKIENEKQCSLRNHWSYIKSLVGQSIQICKSRYMNMAEINGNDSKCAILDCDKTIDRLQCINNRLISEVEDDRSAAVTECRECRCELVNPQGVEGECHATDEYTNGIGYGIDPDKPVDSRSNPLAIDKRTHELLHAPKGIYALGPVTGDNFIRFIPGGALAIVSHIHRERRDKSTD